MMLFFVEAAEIPGNERESIRESVCAQLAKSWRGERVDRAFMQTVYKDAPAELVARFDTADRLAPLMVSASAAAHGGYWPPLVGENGGAKTDHSAAV